jgi:phosphotransferase system, enzyme I, PtsP
MLETLRRIVQAVNSAPDLQTALNIIVRRVKQAIRADVCSVYLVDFDNREHVLQATDGLRPEAVGKVRWSLDKGLIGLVYERAEPVNLADAHTHPRYLFVHETGEKTLHGFLGVPIIQNRRILGVLVVRQKKPRSFGDNEVTFLFTLAAQLAGAITHARASGELVALQATDAPPPRGFFEGRAGAPGVALGQVVVVYPPADLESVPDRPCTDPRVDEALFHAALAGVAAELRGLARQVEDSLPAEDRALFDAWLLMLASDSLVARTVEHIRGGLWAPGALRLTIEEHADVFNGMDDVYLRERASDVRDLGRRILMHMQNKVVQAPEYLEHTILVGEEISAVQLAEVPRGRLAGVVSATGSGFSHVAILARAMGVPAVMGVVDLPTGRLDGRDVIVDGYRGRVYVSPAPTVRAEYERVAAGDRALSAELQALRALPSRSSDGVPMPLYLNTGLVLETQVIGGEDATGVGLYRTEFPFMVRDRFPGESEQMNGYRRVLKAFAPRPVTMRTLDIGGDKPLSYFPLEESNPFLGWRGIRISLDHPEIFLTQVRAMLRAAVGLNNLRLMLPMITTVGEVDDALLLIQRAHDGLLEEGRTVRMPPIGVMVEVPAAVYQVAALAQRVDFLSIGTNDLTQYLLAVDRNNARVAQLYDDKHPAVLRAVLQVIETGRSHGREVGVCGELAGDPGGAVLLLGMGVSSLSMNAGGILPVKRAIRSFTLGEARELMFLALSCESATAVHGLVEDALEAKGLGGLIRRGR